MKAIRKRSIVGEEETWWKKRQLVVGGEIEGGEEGKTRYWAERRKKGNKLNAWRMRRWRM